MRKKAPCANCENSGRVHKRCEKYDEWKIADEQWRQKVRAEKTKCDQWYSFRSEVFK